MRRLVAFDEVLCKCHPLAKLGASSPGVTIVEAVSAPSNIAGREWILIARYGRTSFRCDTVGSSPLCDSRRIMANMVKCREAKPC